MIKNISRSIGAFVAALVATFALSYGTDHVLQTAGILPQGTFYVSWLLIVAVIFYRSVYNTVGGYVVASLSPNHRMGHALALGIVGGIASVVSGIATAKMHLGPMWYSLVLGALSVPSAWLGGKVSSMRHAANEGRSFRGSAKTNRGTEAVA